MVPLKGGKNWSLGKGNVPFLYINHRYTQYRNNIQCICFIKSRRGWLYNIIPELVPMKYLLLTKGNIIACFERRTLPGQTAPFTNQPVSPGMALSGITCSPAMMPGQGTRRVALLPDQQTGI